MSGWGGICTHCVLLIIILCPVMIESAFLEWIYFSEK